MARDSDGPGAAPQLSDDLRSWLGLQEHESVRVLASGARAILLERFGGASPVALPWDRDLVLTADVLAFPLPELLNLIHAAAKSGFLFFEDESHTKAVYLHHGEVVFATSNQNADRLGECLLRMGVITAEQLSEARAAYTPQTQIGRLLVDRGFLTPRELWNGVKLQVEEIVRSLFSYGSGTVCFWEGEVRPDNVVRLSLPTRRLIGEGLKRRDELLKYLAWLEDPGVRIAATARPAASLSGAERAVVQALQGDDRFASLYRRAELDPLSCARTLQLLGLLGAVKVFKAEEPGGDAATAADDAVRNCVIAHVKLLAEFSAPIVAVEGSEGIRDRLERVAEEASRRYPELLSNLRVAPGGVLDPEQIIERALRFPGDREREVGLALGELVSYLEFELMNHPKIDDPDEFLEAMEGLRAQL